MNPIVRLLTMKPATLAGALGLRGTEPSPHQLGWSYTGWADPALRLHDRPFSLNSGWLNLRKQTLRRPTT